MFVAQKAQLVGAIEDPAYAEETIASANFDIEVENLEWSENVAEFQRKLADGTLDSSPSVMGKQSASCSFMTCLNPGSSATDEPKWSKFLQACGFYATGWDGGAEVAVGSAVDGISWRPHKDYTHTPMTFKAFEVYSSGVAADLNKQMVTTMVGCMGNVTFLIGDAGEPIQMNFEFQGSIESVADVAAPVALVPTGVSSVQPPSVLGATVTVGGVSQCISKFEINTGNSVNLWTCATEDSGIKGAYIGSRETTLNIDPIAELVATESVYADWVAGTTGAVAIVLGSTPVLRLDAPTAQKSTVARGERDEARIFEETFRLHKGSSGNDSFELLQGAKT